MTFLRNITFLFTIVNVVFAQEKTQLEIINADYTYFDQETYPDIRRLVGNVVFNHNGAIMNCDSAWYYFKENRFEAFSNIHINQGDTMHLVYFLYSWESKIKNE